MTMFVKVFAVAMVVVAICGGLVMMATSNMGGLAVMVVGTLNGSMCWLFASAVETINKIADKYIGKPTETEEANEDKSAK